MADGPGKYDFLCTMVRERARADGAVIVVLNGYLGSSFSVQIPPGSQRIVAQIFRDVANQMEQEAKKREGG